VQNVARGRAWEIGQKASHVGDADVRGSHNDDQDRLHGLRAAATGHAGWRTGAVVSPGQLVAGAGLIDDEAGETGRAERQQADDDCEDEPSHEASVAPGQDGPRVPPGHVVRVGSGA
jgi:hypothetical protein